MNSQKSSAGLSAGVMAMLAAVVTFSPFAIDSYLPLLPEIRRDLNASEQMVQLSIGAYLLGIAIGPLLWGAVSDAIGRKPLIIWGVVAFSALSFLSAMSPNVEFLIAVRFLQATLSSAAIVGAFAVMADSFKGNELASKSSTLMMAISVAPILAPVIGDVLGQFFGWRAVFWLPGGVSLVLLGFVIRFMPESLPEAARNKLQLRNSLAGYGRVLRSQTAMGYAISASAISAMFFGLVAAGPFIFVDTFGLSPTFFAWFFASSATLAFGANYVNRRMVLILGYAPIITLQVFLAFVVAGLVLGSATSILGNWAVYASVLLLMPLMQVASSNNNAAMMDRLDGDRGTASALFMAQRFSLGFVAILLVGLSGGTMLLRFGGVLLFFALLSGAALLYARCTERG